MGRRPTFDDTQLAAAGLTVVRTNGWEAMSMRTVATELGVTPMALYRVAADAHQLRSLVASHAANTIQPTRTQGTDLSTVLRTWAIDAYDHLGNHRGLASYVIAHWTELAAWLDIVEDLLAVAHDDGMIGADAVAAINAVFAYVLARAQLRDSLHTAPPRELTPIRHNAGRYPFTTANLDEFTTAQTDKHFRIGLDALIAGIE